MLVKIWKGGGGGVGGLINLPSLVKLGRGWESAKVPNPVNKNVKKMMQYTFSFYFKQYLPMWLLHIWDVPFGRTSVTFGAGTYSVKVDVVALEVLHMFAHAERWYKTCYIFL